MTSTTQTEQRISARIKALALRRNMTPEAIEHAACVWALIHRDSAPRSVQTLFTGKPGTYSKRARLLASAFLIAYTEALDRILALGRDDPVDASICWQVALQLAGGAA
jgi:hypothetical protein